MARQLVTIVTCEICKEILIVVFSDQMEVTKELLKLGWQIKDTEDICWKHQEKKENKSEN